MWTKSWQFTASSTIYEMNNFDTIRSDQSIFYRVVEYNGVLETTNVPLTNNSKTNPYACIFLVLILSLFANAL